MSHAYGFYYEGRRYQRDLPAGLPLYRSVPDLLAYSRFALCYLLDKATGQKLWAIAPGESHVDALRRLDDYLWFLAYQDRRRFTPPSALEDEKEPLMANLSASTGTTYTVPTKEFYDHYKPIATRGQQLAAEGLKVQDIAARLNQEGFTSLSGNPLTVSNLYQIRARIPIYEAVSPALFSKPKRTQQTLAPKGKDKASAEIAQLPLPEAVSAPTTVVVAEEAAIPLSGLVDLTQLLPDFGTLNREQIIPVVMTHLFSENLRANNLIRRVEELAQERDRLTQQLGQVPTTEQRIKDLEYELGVKNLEVEEHIKTIESLKQQLEIQAATPAVTDLTQAEKEALSLSGYRI